MARAFSLSRRAQVDLIDAAEHFFGYADRTGPAEKRYDDVWRAIEALVDAPVRHPRCPDFPWTRERVVSGCKIYYEVDPDTGDNATAGDVHVLHIRLPGQDDPVDL